jgi:hypothetical protein
MTGLGRTTLCGSVAGLALFVAAGQGFAVEPGDFQATLRGVTMGIPLGAAPPPGFYFDLETFMGPNAAGVGQNSAAAGAVGGKGLTVFGQALIGSLVWSTGWNVLGGNVTFAAIQPFFTVAGLQTQCTQTAVGCVGSAPIAFGAGAGAFFENIHNTIWSSSVSWNYHNGWFTSAGLNIQGPDGSQYEGTLNQDYWTFSPTFAVAYLSKDWQLSANFDYDIHTASEGHTGSYAALANNVPGLPALVAPNGCVGFACPGIGYTGGQQLFIDWAAKYNVTPKWQVGPVGYFKFQTTDDTPGSGYTCAALSANPAYGPSLSCGKATDIALGGMVGYNLGPANIGLYVTDSVYTRDDFDGWSIFTRVSFKLDDGTPPSSKPLITK